MPDSSMVNEYSQRKETSHAVNGFIPARRIFKLEGSLDQVSCQKGNQVKNDKTESKDLKSDFSQALSRRPVEIPGGLGKVTFNVIKHKEPPWWKQIFKFLESGTAKELVSTFGLPGVNSAGR